MTGFSTSVLSQLCAKLRAKLVLRLLRDNVTLRRDREALIEQAGEDSLLYHVIDSYGVAINHCHEWNVFLGARNYMSRALLTDDGLSLAGRGASRVFTGAIFEAWRAGASRRMEGKAKAMQFNQYRSLAHHDLPTMQLSTAFK